jgi:hypothetical protein
VIEKFNVKQGFLRQAAANVGNTGVHDVSLTKEGVSVQATQPAAPAPHAAQPAAPAQPASPFRMPSFAAKPPSAAPAQPSTAGAGLFQKGATSSPFGRPRAATTVPRMPTFGRDVAKPAADADDEIELRPYVPKKK